MKDIIVLLLIVGSAYVLIQIMQKKPILPWREPKIKEGSYKTEEEEKSVRKISTKNRQKELLRKNEELEKEIDEDISIPFKKMFPEIESFSEHMIKSKGNNFSMVAEVMPVNYFLLDEEEQERVDNIFETWIAQFEYPVRIYLQSRYIDLTEQIEHIESTMGTQENLYHKLEEYGQIMVSNLKAWQNEMPRYEVKRYLIFDIMIPAKDVKVEAEGDFEARLYEKAFTELHRRVMSAQRQLRKSENEVELLTSEGIAEVLYYSFNRKKALKNRFRDVFDKEQMASFITADQSVQKIVSVKGAIEEYERENKEIYTKEEAREENKEIESREELSIK